jgi:hypothetical protein
MTSEAALRYLDGIGRDCASVLGPDSAVLSVDHEDLGGGVRLRVRYEIRGTVHEAAATGETIVAAHTALRVQLVRERLEISFTDLTHGA